MASPIIVNATPGDTATERLLAFRELLLGKTLVDVSNATTRGDDGTPGALLYPSSSLAEQLHAALSETAVVETLNTMLFSVMAEPGCLSAAATAFVSGDDANAKAAVRGLWHDLGWADDQILDLGGVRTARGSGATCCWYPM